MAITDTFLPRVKHFSAALLLAVCSGLLWGPHAAGADSPDRHSIVLRYLSMDRQETEDFYTHNRISRVLDQHEMPALCPDLSFAAEIKNSFAQLQGNIGVETLFFIPHTKDISLLSLFNILLSVSTMEGTEYYSASRDTMRTLFTESTIIDGETSKNPLPDPVVSELPGRYEVYLQQTDLTFGTNVSRSIYKNNDNSIWVHTVNLTNMRYLFMNMVRPENISINLVVRPVEGGILFYGATSVKTISFFGLERRRIDSFHNRIEAMYNWFAEKLNDEV